MALLFDANTERVDYGSGASLDDITAGSALHWIRPTDFTSDYGNAYIFNKGGITWASWIDTFDGSLNFQINRATTTLYVAASAAQLGAWWAINTWLCVGIA